MEELAFSWEAAYGLVGSIIVILTFLVKYLPKRSTEDPRVEGVKRDIAKAKTGIAGNKAGIAEIKDVVAEVENEVAEVKETASTTRRRLYAIEADLKSLNDKVAAIQGQLDDI